MGPFTEGLAVQELLLWVPLPMAVACIVGKLLLLLEHAILLMGAVIAIPQSALFDAGVMAEWIMGTSQRAALSPPPLVIAAGVGAGSNEPALEWGGMAELPAAASAVEEMGEMRGRGGGGGEVVSCVEGWLLKKLAASRVPGRFGGGEGGGEREREREREERKK